MDALRIEPGSQDLARKYYCHLSLYSIIIHQNEQFRAGKNKKKPLCTRQYFRGLKNWWELKTSPPRKPEGNPKSAGFVKQWPSFPRTLCKRSVPLESVLWCPDPALSVQEQILDFDFHPWPSHECDISFRARFANKSHLVFTSSCSNSSRWE